MAHPASEWGDLTRRRMHLHKSFVSYPSDKDVFIVILRAPRENVHANVHCGICATLKFCYKIANVARVSLAN